MWNKPKQNKKNRTLKTKNVKNLIKLKKIEKKKEGIYDNEITFLGGNNGPYFRAMPAGSSS